MFRATKGVQDGLLGFRLNLMPASSGDRPPFKRLHSRQAQTIFSQVVSPPRERGTT